MLNEIKTYWFLSAKFGSSKDQTDRFINIGIWENGYDNKYLNIVRTISVGDQVAIKAAYNQKNNLPFDNRGQFVSVMEIKAIGTVTKNHGDGKLLEVDWQQTNLNKKWYFYTNIATIWAVKNDFWLSEQLINFAFYDKAQDIDYFRNAPYWRSRYGDIDTKNQLFKWTQFYETIADHLLVYKDKQKRPKLMGFINQLATEFNLNYLLNKNLQDICPFTALGTFNRHIKEVTRKEIAQKWATFLGVNEPIPNSFEGIPLLNNQISWFFTDSENQQQEIDNLWDFYAIALNFSDSNESYQDDFKQKFDLVLAQPYCSWQLTNGLFWIRPNSYVVLDRVSKIYIGEDLGLINNKNLIKEQFKGTNYLRLLDDLSVRFAEDYFPVHSFPELYLTALRKYENYISDKENELSRSQWQSILLDFIKQLCEQNGTNTFTRKQLLNEYREPLKTLFPNNKTIEDSVSYILQRLRDKHLLLFLKKGNYQLLDINIEDEKDETELDADNQEVIEQEIVRQPYTSTDLINEGCFVDTQQIEAILNSLRSKKNLILQGPPGTGKTWLAKRLANIIIGYKDSNNIKAIQFHPNMSYEDFVRGFRPSSDGKLSLVDGPFLEIINQARSDSQSKYVIVIEEINRGNPAQIFGEMLTLLEADKRTPNEALELTYRHENEKGIFIPANLYVIGTMNIADRSLAMVDFALRRRFAFFNLAPNFSDSWLNYMKDKTNLTDDELKQIQQRMENLNQYISDDHMLGEAFTVGHSYFTYHSKITDAKAWFEHIVNSEIKPLLEEYWFDDKSKLNKAMKILLPDDN